MALYGHFSGIPGTDFFSDDGVASSRNFPGRARAMCAPTPGTQTRSHLTVLDRLINYQQVDGCSYCHYSGRL